MKLEEAVRAELLYRLEAFLEERHMEPKQFSEQFKIPLADVTRVLQRRELPFRRKERICAALSISPGQLESPPDGDGSFQRFLELILELSLSSLTMEQRKARMKQEQERMGASQSLWNRYSVWAEYEIKLAQKQLDFSEHTEYPMAGLVEEIKDRETYDQIAAELKKAKEKWG